MAKIRYSFFPNFQIKETKNLGAFFKNKKSSRTLILCERLKDEINANIAFHFYAIIAL